MRIKQSIGSRVFNVFNILLMLILAMLFLFPYLNIMAKAFNDPMDAARGGLTIYPRVFSLENFKALLSDSAVFMAAFVSVVRVLITVVLSLCVQFLAAYALTRSDLPGKNIITFYFTIPMFISAGLIPMYVLIKNVGLLNNFWVYILPTLFSFYNVVIIRTFIQSTIPRSLEESAYIDGAGELRIFSMIIIPLSKPILATIALWVMVNSWNDWTTTLYYIRNPKLYTLQYLMMQLIKETERLQKMQEAAIASGLPVENIKQPTSSEGIIAAQVIVSTVPIICIYPFLQKYFVKGIMMGSVKG